MSSKHAKWSAQIEAWRTSGQSAAAFCRARGLAYAQFVYWQRKLREPIAAGAALVPVTIASAPTCASDLRVELVLSGGLRVQVLGVGAADVVALVRGLSC